MTNSSRNNFPNNSPSNSKDSSDNHQRVRIYTMGSCPFCTRAKNLLSKRGISYQEILVPDNDDAQWAALYQLSGLRTMPQIFNGDQLIGGYTELAELDQQDQLKSLK